MGGNSNKRQIAAADQAERERAAQVERATQRIDSIFNSPARTNQYKDFLNALRSHYTGDARRQRGQAGRQLKFAMARAGQSGGSLDVDSRENLGDEFMRAMLEAERRAQGATESLRARDEGTRLDLLGLAQSGADITTGTRRAAETLRASMDPRGAMVEGLGDMFGNTMSLVQRNREATARRRADRDYLYGSGGSMGGGG